MKKNSKRNGICSVNDMVVSSKRWNEELKTYREQYQFATKKKKEEKRRRKRLRNDLSVLQEVQEIVQEISENIQNVVHSEISAVVSQCLNSVFDDPYTFKIDFQKKRGKTEARLLLERDGLVIDDPLEEAGGGVIDIVVFALRVACVLRSTSHLRRLIILDEPFRHLHPDLRSTAMQMVKEIAKKTKTQFIIVSHMSHEIEGIGKIVRVN